MSVGAGDWILCLSWWLVLGVLVFPYSLVPPAREAFLSVSLGWVFLVRDVVVTRPSGGERSRGLVGSRGARVGNLGRHFCWRGCAGPPGDDLVGEDVLVGCLVAAVRAAVGVVAVTWLWVMDRMASRRTVVNEISSVVTLPATAAVWAARRTSWVAVSQAQISCRTSSGLSERRSGHGRAGVGDGGLVLADGRFGGAPPL